MNDTKIPSIQSLKKTAKLGAKQQQIPLSQALDQAAQSVGFSRWALLAKHHNNIRFEHTQSLWKNFYPGEILMIAAEQGAGKLTLALQLATHAAEQGQTVHIISAITDGQLIQKRLAGIISASNLDLPISSDLFQIETHYNSLADIIELCATLPQNHTLIVDHLPALTDWQPASKTRHSALLKLKQRLQQKSNRLIMLNQISQAEMLPSLEAIAGGANLAQHFQQVVLLERASSQSTERKLSLVKSTHYQKQQHLLPFDQERFYFH